VEPANYLERLEDAFSAVPYPVGDDYFKAIADRDYRSISDVNPGCERMICAHVGRELLLKYYDLLFYLSASGIQYYLPAYIRTILADPDLIDHWLGETLLMTLGEVNTEQYTNNQLRLLTVFLNHMKNLSSYGDVVVDSGLLDMACQNIERENVEHE